MKPCVEEPVQGPSSATKKAPRPQPTCVLSIGDQQLPAAIVEERGGTMHIVVQGSPQFWVEDDGTLKTPVADFLVRVFNIVREKEDEAEDDESVGDIPTFRIGLERLGPIERAVDPDDMFDQPIPEPKKTEAAANGEKKRRISSLGALALAMTAAVLVGVVVVWKTHSGNWTLGLGLTGANSSANGKPDSQPIAEQPGSDARPKPPGVELSGLPGAAPFAQPEIVKKLDLTPSQTDAIRRLNKITLQAVNDLEKYWGSGDRWELAQKRSMLLSEARQQALQLLTDSQRRLWEEMTK